MNRALLNPFESSDLPRTVQSTLEDEQATCMRFNRHGNILAVGTVSGRVILWNFDTRTIATTLADDLPPEADASARRIVSLTFPAPGNASAVIVAYANGALRVYHTLTRVLVSELLFDVGLHQVEAHPKIDNIVVVVPINSLPLLVHIRRGRYRLSSSKFKSVTDPTHVMCAPTVDTSPSSMLVEPALPPKTTYGNKRISNVQPPSEAGVPFSLVCVNGEFNDEGQSSELTGAKRRDLSGAKRRANFAIAFTRTKQRVLRGGPSGLIRVFELQLCGSNRFVTANCISSVSIPGRAAIRSITLSRRERVLVNSQDRCMRLYRIWSLERPVSNHDDVVVVSDSAPYVSVEPERTFTEIVNRALCRSSCFSHDGDFVLGGMEGAQHRIHVWRVQDAQLDVTLEGPKEGIAELLMHPLRSVMVSLGAMDGAIYIWAKEVSENWSAFSTQFSELEANEEYVEKEDEFDVNHNDATNETHSQEREREEAEDIDIVGQSSAWFPSDSETEDSFFYVPVAPLPDDGIDGNCEVLLTDTIMSVKADEIRRNENEKSLSGENVSNNDRKLPSTEEISVEVPAADGVRKKRGPNRSQNRPSSRGPNRATRVIRAKASSSGNGYKGRGKRPKGDGGSTSGLAHGDEDYIQREENHSISKSDGMKNAAVERSVEIRAKPQDRRDSGGGDGGSDGGSDDGDDGGGEKSRKVAETGPAGQR